MASPQRTSGRLAPVRCLLFIKSGVNMDYAVEGMIFSLYGHSSEDYVHEICA